MSLFIIVSFSNSPTPVKLKFSNCNDTSGKVRKKLMSTSSKLTLAFHVLFNSFLAIFFIFPSNTKGRATKIAKNAIITDIVIISPFFSFGFIKMWILGS